MIGDQTVLQKQRGFLPLKENFTIHMSQQNNPMHIYHNFQLAPITTFHVSAVAKQYVVVEKPDDLLDLAPILTNPILIIGSGSNLLFTKDFDGTLLSIATDTIQTVKEDGDVVYVRADAGVIWDDLVRWCVDHDYAGLENLSAIPGTVGASPVQNIGAYGVEVGHYIFSVTTHNIKTAEEKTWSHEECAFDYRTSFFKTNTKEVLVVSSVVFKLSKSFTPNLSYKDVETYCIDTAVNEPKLQDIRDAICSIRANKLPNPSILGNAGSFFKNPIVPIAKAEALQSMYATLPSYSYGDDEKKLSAGWLIDQCGWKGYRKGNAGVHEKHALVLVNYGKATGSEIYTLAKEIIASVEEKFAITLEPEVRIL